MPEQNKNTRTTDLSTKQPLFIDGVSRSVFFQVGKCYKKIGVNGDDIHYFKCDKENSKERVYADAWGVELYISPGLKCAQIFLTAYQCIFKGWKEITKKEFTLNTKKYVSRVVSEFS